MNNSNDLDTTKDELYSIPLATGLVLHNLAMQWNMSFPEEMPDAKKREILLNRMSGFPKLQQEDLAPSLEEKRDWLLGQEESRIHRPQPDRHYEIVYLDYEMKFNIAGLTEKHTNICPHNKMKKVELFTSHYYECLECKVEVSYDEKRVVKNS